MTAQNFPLGLDKKKILPEQFGGVFVSQSHDRGLDVICHMIPKVLIV